MPQATVSVVVCSNGRPAALKSLHAALWRQTYPNFEIIYVIGPARDGAFVQAAEWARTLGVKTARCAEENLSKARNQGVALASGEFVAFVDDDALPEPIWLERLVESFEAPETGIVGGAVLDPGGADYQFHYSVADRFGQSYHELSAPFDDGAYPFSPLYPHVMGANFMVRRTVLVELGGFDEEYEYFLDETDLCCRAIDAGHSVRQQPLAVVHHKFLPNPLRGESKILVSKFPILKNKVYFCLINSPNHLSFAQTLSHLLTFFHRHRTELANHAAAGRVPPFAVEQFDTDAERAWRQGLERGLSNQRRLQSDLSNPGTFAPFVPSRRVYSDVHILLAGDATPQASAALVRARQLTATGRQVHVVFGDADADNAELCDGVWMHWRKSRHFPMHAKARELQLPEPLWHTYAAACAEVRRLATCAPPSEIEDLSDRGLSLPLLWEPAPGPLAVRLRAHGLELPANFQRAGSASPRTEQTLLIVERALLEGASTLRMDDAQAREAIARRLQVDLAALVERSSLTGASLDRNL